MNMFQVFNLLPAKNSKSHSPLEDSSAYWVQKELIHLFNFFHLFKILYLCVVCKWSIYNALGDPQGKSQNCTFK